MIENTISAIVIGFLLGAPAGISPGPMLILIISETFQYGLRAGAKVAFTPLLTDIPVLIISGLLFAKISNIDLLLGIISLSGAAFITSLAVRGLKNANFKIAFTALKPLKFRELILVNITNPNPYLFWFTVGAPLMVQSFQNSFSLGAIFLLGFYIGLVGTKFVLAVVASKSRGFLKGTLYKRIIQFLNLLLLGFVFLLISEGITLLGLDV